MAITLGQLDILLRAAEGDNVYPELNQVHQALNAGLFGGKVLDKDLTTPPAGTDENLYIVGPAASGAWSGEDGNLAVYDGGATAWQFIPKREGMLVWVADEDELYVYNGSAWAIFESGGGATTLDDLTDVDTAGAISGDALTFDGADWVPTPLPNGDDGVIFDSTLSGTAASIDTGAAGIPAGYDVLEIWFIGRTDEAVTNSLASFQVNNDSGANYDVQNIQGANTTASAAVSQGATAWTLSVTGANAASGNFGIVRITIPAYAQTTVNKIGEATHGNADQTTLATRRAVTDIVGWRSTAAITRFAVTAPSTKVFAIGSRLLIIGKPVTGGGGGTLDGLDDVVITGAATGEVLTFDGSNWVNADPGTVAAPATVYISNAGDDVTGDGTIGLPYETMDKALSVFPSDLGGAVYAVDSADGTYPEVINVDRFCNGTIKVIGDTTTPANVSFTGTDSYTHRGVTDTATVHVDGSVTLELEGVRVNATVDRGVWAVNGARVILDRCTVTGTLERGVTAWDGAAVDFNGNVTVSGFTIVGVHGVYGSRMSYSTAGTLTVTGGASTAWGISLASQSDFSIYSGQPSGIAFVITVVTYGFQLGLSSTFTHQGPSGSITIDNVTTPSSSAAVQCTDHSSFSTPNALTLDHFTNGFDLSSISYAEATGTRTYTNLGATSSVVQNSVYYAP